MKRIKSLKKELKEANENINKFEKQYKKSLFELEKEGVGTKINTHDDYMEWVFWQNVQENAKQLIYKYESFGENIS